MIELFLKENEGHSWDLRATLFPQGGIGGLAREATILSVEEGTFRAAVRALSEVDLSMLTFELAPDRWPVPEPKCQIVNDGTSLDRESFGNYEIRAGGILVGRIENFPRGQRGDLIKAALDVVVKKEESSIA